MPSDGDAIHANVLIVGGGAHGLALLSALHERSLAFPEYSDKNARVGLAAMGKIGSVTIIDSGECFLSESWHARFEALEIEHLRSPALAHPKALEPLALVNFAVREGRTSEIVHHAPGGGGGGAGRRRGPPPLMAAADGMDSQHPLMLGLPSTALFKDFCAEVVSQLPHRWLRGTATPVQKDDAGKLCVQYARAAGQGSGMLTADAVVLATGPHGKPNIPGMFRPLVGSGRMTHTEHGGARARSAICWRADHPGLSTTPAPGSSSWVEGSRPLRWLWQPLRMATEWCFARVDRCAPARTTSLPNGWTNGTRIGFASTSSPRAWMHASGS
jgi:hypothetical protein